MKISSDIVKSKALLNVGDQLICVKAWSTAHRYGIFRGRTYTISKFSGATHVGFFETDRYTIYPIKPFFKPFKNED